MFLKVKIHLVYETQIIRSTLMSEYSETSLFVSIAEASAKPNNEWSVKTVLKPMDQAWKSASCAIDENVWKCYKDFGVVLSTLFPLSKNCKKNKNFLLEHRKWKLCLNLNLFA